MNDSRINTLMEYLNVADQWDESQLITNMWPQHHCVSPMVFMESYLNESTKRHRKLPIEFFESLAEVGLGGLETLLKHYAALIPAPVMGGGPTSLPQSEQDILDHIEAVEVRLQANGEIDVHYEQGPNTAEDVSEVMSVDDRRELINSFQRTRSKRAAVPGANAQQHTAAASTAASTTAASTAAAPTASTSSMNNADPESSDEDESYDSSDDDSDCDGTDALSEHIAAETDDRLSDVRVGPAWERGTMIGKFHSRYLAHMMDPLGEEFAFAKLRQSIGPHVANALAYRRMPAECSEMVTREVEESSLTPRAWCAVVTQCGLQTYSVRPAKDLRTITITFAFTKRTTFVTLLEDENLAIASHSDMRGITSDHMCFMLVLGVMSGSISEKLNTAKRIAADTSSRLILIKATLMPKPVSSKTTASSK